MGDVHGVGLAVGLLALGRGAHGPGSSACRIAGLAEFTADDQFRADSRDAPSRGPTSRRRSCWSPAVEALAASGTLGLNTPTAGRAFEDAEIAARVGVGDWLGVRYLETGLKNIQVTNGRGRRVGA
jgi:hypothetical protein